MPEMSKHEPGEFSWAELATSDSDAAKKFYGGLFGWSYSDSPAGPDMIYTRIQRNGKDVAALYKMGAQMQGVPPHWNTYVTVASADASAKKAKELGGKVMMEPFDVMEHGRMAIVQDPQGAVFSLWEPRAHIGAEIMGDPNTVCWSELETTDREGAQRFYTSLFPWRPKPGGDYTEWQLNGRSIGGMMKIPKEWGPVPPHWLTYFAVSDCDGTVKKATASGGGAIVPPTDIPDAGRFAVLRDPQGAVFAIIQLKPR